MTEEVLGSEWDDIRSLLFQLRRVSEAHFKHWRETHGADTTPGTGFDYASKAWSWSIFEQLSHMHSEVSEVYTALRKGKPHSEVLDEIWDCVFSVITAAHVIGYDDESILTSMVRCLRKIQGRVKEAA